jgi:hypothetical protein
MAKEALRFSFEGSRGVGRPKVNWCGNVKPPPSRSSTLNICQGDCTGRGKGSTSLACR